MRLFVLLPNGSVCSLLSNQIANCIETPVDETMKTRNGPDFHVQVIFASPIQGYDFAMLTSAQTVAQYRKWKAAGVAEGTFFDATPVGSELPVMREMTRVMAAGAGSGEVKPGGITAAPRVNRGGRPKGSGRAKKVPTVAAAATA